MGAEPTPRGGGRPQPGARTGSAPSVSVIVPCYGYGHLLEGCLASVLSQEQLDVQVLLIDDCSPDRSAEIARTLAERDTRVHSRAHRRNMGLIATANEGLQWAQGDYVVLLSADDMLVEGSLRRATEVMERHPDVGMVYGRPLLAREGMPAPTSAGAWRGTTIWAGADWIRGRCRAAHNCISSPEVVLRGAVQREVGHYDARCRHASDLNMWLRVAAVADVARIRGAPQAIYRVHADSMLRSAMTPTIDLSERRAAFDCFFEASAAHIEEARLRRMTGRALARQALWQASRAVDRGQEGDLVDALSAFALDVYEDARRLREWRGLRLRRAIGAGRSLAFLPFLATGAAHRARVHLAAARWRLRGV